MKRTQFNGKYIKLADDPDYWVVDNGKRRKLTGPDEVYAIGLRQVVVVSEDVMGAIPLEGGGDEVDGREGDPLDA